MSEDQPRKSADDTSQGSRPGQAPPPDPSRTPWRVEPAPDGRGAPDRQGGKGKKGKSPTGMSWQRFGLLLLALFTLNFFLTSLLPGGERPARISYSPVFLNQVKAGNVKEISSRGETVSGVFNQKFDPPGKHGPTTKFTTEFPTFAVNGSSLAKLLQDNNVIVNAESPNQGRGLLATLLISLLPTLLLIGVFVWIARRAAGAGAGGLGAQFGRSKAKRVEIGSTRTTFNDVAGIEEAKEELMEVVDFLRNPDKYKKLGAKIPRGVLLSGQPGTGKTLLARAMAGEAEVPFFSASASEFIEMIVGVGASRVRDLFDEAKKAAPAIIFIDELDAIGRARGGGGGLGGHDEREQTLNQVLTEMDGFDPSLGVIVLAATNRPEILDSALLRPGRFDRRVVVQSPDKVGRAQILAVHTRSVPLEEGIDLAAIAASTPGMVGADLANLVNEAALLAAKRGHTRVQLADFTDGLEKVILGAERRVVMSDSERERTAYHEAGHALVGMLTEGADPVRKISIIPRGQALGVTLSAPEADRFNYDQAYLRGKILVALGGRVAEEVVYGTITTGAESDIQQLTNIARGMVTRWGMSEVVGPIAVEASNPNGMLLPGTDGVSQATQQLIDQEVRRIVDEAHHDVTLLLTEHREQLEQLTQELLKVETLDETDAYLAAGVLREPREENASSQPTSGQKPSAPLGEPAEV
ncbi:ATP-dependent zinc metalloprotease FtsH [Paraconexibacter antarcticus]|uniref:ATP-dependent zinc metalloprotease FtsH n=1 Tax=Paraconexibacter antarcticus TaxID=2949664 RepID=A0ABY5DL03_9ACTN|nr:ATP-dependent zinc metalloprotease FtsH [Paraconexibacter antarcticus]UTI62450.1 ATP-dependent zinc metalloprotease FtsH [Paraconexibacter antarcticus]